MPFSPGSRRIQACGKRAGSRWSAWAGRTALEAGSLLAALVRPGTICGLYWVPGCSAGADAGLPAEPFHIGPGVGRAEFQAAWQGLGEHQRCGGLEFIAEQPRRAGRLEPE